MQTCDFEELIVPAQSQTLQLDSPSWTLSQSDFDTSYPTAVQVPETAPSSTILLVLTFCVWLLRQRMA
ncbi:hypothetical protein NEA10_00890 [Phormidium yuhuli AB48]|uniref:PEP-CTERM sorting domain-containing protein n=1 Tax=Phormidium yuhuli AB48 TaxID=2940671 RepID=A0ABY5AR69_9CYAN|nr:hypothetical protein [Phormidium yuhuli]USR91330.1 hypothetical protein NEA10_00890 [Phormidium yuhuli AB48]